jgi:hypothetical protein
VSLDKGKIILKKMIEKCVGHYGHMVFRLFGKDGKPNFL